VRIATEGNITIRRAVDADGQSLVRLAELDSKRLPSGTFLIAEVEGEQRAAIAVDSGEVVADPFQHTANIVELLQMRAARIREAQNPDLARKRGVAKMTAAAARLLRRAPAESRP
jgi:hypothetical protein